jgi:hypothetical protein
MKSKLSGQPASGKSTGPKKPALKAKGQTVVNGNRLPTTPISWEEYERDHITAAERKRLDLEVAEELAIIDLAQLRRACKVTQKQLAEQLKTSQSNVARLEAAKGKTFVSVMRVARALGLDIQIWRSGKKVWPQAS